MSDISFVAVGPDDASEREEWLTALARTIDTNAYCLGPEVEGFEKQCSEYLDIPHTIGVSNGSDAIRIGLQALGVGHGDEVIVPAMSFFSSASSIAQLGAKPVFVDIDPDTLLIDPDHAERAMTSKTKVIMPVQLYGQGADMDRLNKIACSKEAYVFEDAAQCFGARYDDRALGAVGMAGSYSFYPTKNLGAPGDAGMIVTRDQEVAARMRRLRAHGDVGGYQHESLGWNARMDGFQAAILSIKLDRLDAMHARRRQNAERYSALLEESGKIDRIRPLARTPKSSHVWHQYIVRVADRDAVRAKLGERGIPSAIYYPGTLPAQPCFQELGHKPGDFPVSERAVSEVLALPVHHRLPEDAPDRVIEALTDIVA